MREPIVFTMRQPPISVPSPMAAWQESTTHTITGAIVGVGAARRVGAVRWGVAGRIVWAWILTIPLSAAVAATMYLLLRLR